MRVLQRNGTVRAVAPTHTVLRNDHELKRSNLFAFESELLETSMFFQIQHGRSSNKLSL